MAERITALPDHRSRLYPWVEWTDGSMWRIRQGEDFQVSPRSMAQIVREYARRRNLTVTASVNKRLGAVEFRFSAPEKEAA